MATVTAPSSLTDASVPSLEKRSYAKIIEQTWIWSVVGYSILRFFIAWGAFGSHGVNPWIFGLIDVGTAWPYAKSVAVVCKQAAGSEWRRLPLSVSVAVFLFFAPYLYLWFGAGEMPAGMRVGMAICVSVLLLAATVGVLSKIRKMRRDSTVLDLTSQDDVMVLAAVDAGVHGEVIDVTADQSNRDMLIDLTGDDAEVRRATLHG